jgi:hypothetical protein
MLWRAAEPLASDARSDAFQAAMAGCRGTE